MAEQKKLPPSFGAYTLPAQFELDAMEEYAKIRKNEIIEALDLIVELSFNLHFSKPEHALMHIQKYLTLYKKSLW